MNKKQNRNKNNKIQNKHSQKSSVNKIIGISIVTALAILIAGSVYAAFFHLSDEKTVVTVNGYPITAEELKKEMLRDKTYIITYFQDEYNAKVEGDLWNTKYGDTTPNEYLREYALEKLISYKVEQELAVSYGLLEKNDTTYQAFLKQLEEENAIRADKLAEDEVVYGTQSYTENTYFSYTYSNMQLALQEIMEEEGEPLYATESEVRAWYEATKEERFTASEIMKLEAYSILIENSNEGVLNAETGESGSTAEQEAKAVLEQLKEDLQEGLSIEQIQAQYPNVTCEEISIDDDNAGSMQKTSMTFYEAADAMQAGDVSEVLYDRNTYTVMKCISKEEGGYKDFEAYQSGITKEYTSEKYMEYVKHLVEQAEVTRKRILKKVVMK